MELSRVIIGAIVTEKAERLKGQQVYTLQVAPKATKVDVRQALQKYYGVNVASVRAMRTPSKVRNVGRASTIVKRQPTKKILVSLTKDSKPLDITSFKA